MAYLFSDGFDWMGSTADATLRWDSAGSLSALVSGASTAFGVGGALTIGNGGSLAKTLPSNEGTLFLNVRMKTPSSGVSQNVGSYVAFYDGSNLQCVLRWNIDFSLGLYDAANGGTLIAGPVAGVRSQNAWDSWQVKVVVHNTAGSIEVRKNGSTTAIFSATGLNTRRGSTNAYANRIVLGSTTSTSGETVDDFFVNSASGAAPTDWPGDLRCVTSRPTGASQSQFTANTTVASVGQGTTGVGLSGSANTIYFGQLAAPQAGNLTTGNVTITAAITGKLNVAVYADSGGAPGALLAQATEITNPGIGAQAFTFTTNPAVTRGQTLWFAVMASAAPSFNGAAISRATQAQAYTSGFPATATPGTVASAVFPVCSIALNGVPAYSLVQDPSGQDGDTSYVYSSTVGATDLYSFPALTTVTGGVTPAAITGVLPFVVCKKSDSGQRVIDVAAKNGATTVTAATSSTVGLSYTFLGGWLATDPATGASWANAAAVDTLAIGPRISA